MEEEKLKDIIWPILEWYQENRRILPWREDKNPYHIWLSEIMLQQTRIEAVKGYYTKFIEQLPTIHDLAQVEEDYLLKLWEGLGYYNRARNLKKAAQIIEENYQGKMPKSYQELLMLPGIGEYTAGAIASIAHQEKVPAIDGNVLRVVSRVLADKSDVLLPETKKKVTKWMKEIMPKEAGDFNEGLMELGELICLPNGEPVCEKCPLKQQCKAREKDLIKEIPVRNKKTVRKIEERTVYVLCYQNQVAIQKREEKGLLANLYEFPNELGKKDKKEAKEQMERWNLKVNKIEEIGEAKHIFSHKEWHMIGYQIEVVEKKDTFLWVPIEKVWEEYAIPTAFASFQKILK